MRELTGLEAGRLARLIAARAASAREVAEAHLRAIEADGGRVNAVVQVDGERALAAGTLIACPSPASNGRCSAPACC